MVTVRLRKPFCMMLLVSVCVFVLYDNGAIAGNNIFLLRCVSQAPISGQG